MTAYMWRKSAKRQRYHVHHCVVYKAFQHILTYSYGFIAHYFTFLISVSYQHCFWFQQATESFKTYCMLLAFHWPADIVAFLVVKEADISFRSWQRPNKELKGGNWTQIQIHFNVILFFNHHFTRWWYISVVFIACYFSDWLERGCLIQKGNISAPLPVCVTGGSNSISPQQDNLWSINLLKK